MDAAWTSKMLVSYNITTQSHNLETTTWLSHLSTKQIWCSKQSL